MLRFFKPLEAVKCFIICAVLFLLVFNAPIVQAQVKVHDLGKFKLEHNVRENTNTDALTQGTGNWPQDVYWSGNFNFQYFGRYVESWYDAEGNLHEKTSHSSTTFRNQEGFFLTEYRRFAPPVVDVFADGVWQVDSRHYDGVVDPSIPSDMMVVNKTKFSPGLWAKVKSYTLSNPNHDDYAIYEVTYTFTGDNDNDPELEVDTDYGLKGVYFVFAYNMADIRGTWIQHSRWYASAEDDWTNWQTYTSTLVPGGRPLEIIYEWDGDDLGTTEFEPGNTGPNGAFDDTGDPRFGIGEGGNNPMPSAEFTSSNYNGMAILHADQSVSNKSDDFTQPYSIITSVNVQAVWGNIFGNGLYPTVWDWANSGTREDWTTTPGYPDDPEVLIGDMPHQAIGPYDLALGDSVTIVLVIATGAINRDLEIEKGLEWRSWYRGEAGATFDDAAKDALLATGKDSLFQTIDRAYWAWSRGMDVPDPLPAPNLKVISGPNRNDLEWEDMSDVGDPDTGVPDLDHYNIYRKRGSYLEDTDEELRESGVHERWQFITSVPASQTTYSDETVIRGEAYHYAVTAVDDGSQNTDGLFPGQKLESSPYKNRNLIPVKAFQPGENNTDHVLIVPNPFISGAQDFNFFGNASNYIHFVNLPPYCKLSIYTVTGDLIKTIDHVTGSADAEWDQITESNQYVASGVYILRISEATFLDGSKLPDAIEKFVIVR